MIKKKAYKEMNTQTKEEKRLNLGERKDGTNLVGVN